MEDINIKINRENRTVIANKYCIGNDGENLQGNIVFSFDEFVDGQARLEYVIKGAKAYQMLEKDGETYKIPIKKVLTKEGTIDMQLVITLGTDETEISVFKSNIFSMFCDRSINSEIEQPDEYLTWIEVANTKLNEIDEALSEITEMKDYATEQANYAKEQGNYAKSVGEEVETKASEGAFNGKSLEFIWKGTKLGIRLEGDTEYTYVDLQGVQGLKGDTGEPFKIKKTYSSVEEMKSDFDNMLFGDYVMIATSVEVEDNAKLFSRGESEWIFITDFSGAMGIRGETGLTPNIKIGTVNTLEPSEEATVTRTGTNEEPIFNFGIPKGPQGDDYVLQESDKQEIIENITSDANSVFNQNVIEKTNEFNTNAETKVNEFNETVDSLQEEIDDLYNNQIFNEASGESIHLTDSANAKLGYLEVEGNSYQETTSGKNKLAILPYKNYVSNGITTSFDGRTFSYSGTLSSSWFDLCKNYDTNLQAGRYLLSVTSKNLNRVVLAVTYDDGTYGAFHIITNTVKVIVETTQAVTKMRLFNDGQTTGDVLSGTIECCMLEPMISGDIPTEYEPYTGGIASPNPDYPQEVEVIEGDIGVKVIGKNLLDLKFYENATDYYSVLNGDITLLKADTRANGIIDANNCLSLSAGTYTYIAKNKMERCLCQNRLTGETIFDVKNVTYHTFILENETLLYFKLLSPSNNFPQTIQKTMILEGTYTTEQEYEPYKEEITYIDLQGNFVGKLPNGTKDRLYIENNHLYLEKRVGKAVLDGSEYWGKSMMTANNSYYYTLEQNQQNYKFKDINQNNISKEGANGIIVTPSYSKHFKTISPVDLLNQDIAGMSFDIKNSINIEFRIGFSLDTNILDVNLLKTRLSENPVEVYYELAEPQIIDLGYIKTPKTLENTSNISLLANLETNMSLKYVQHTRTILDNIQNQINNIMTAIIPENEEVE